MRQFLVHIPGRRFPLQFDVDDQPTIAGSATFAKSVESVATSRCLENRKIELALQIAELNGRDFSIRFR